MLSQIPIFMCVHIYIYFQHLYFPQHVQGKLFLNLEEAQVTDALLPLPTGSFVGSLVQTEVPSRQLISLWLGVSAPMIRLHCWQSRRSLPGTAPPKGSAELGTSSNLPEPKTRAEGLMAARGCAWNGRGRTQKLQTLSALSTPCSWEIEDPEANESGALS